MPFIDKRGNRIEIEIRERDKLAITRTTPGGSRRKMPGTPIFVQLDQAEKHLHKLASMHDWTYQV